MSVAVGLGWVGADGAGWGGGGGGWLWGGLRVSGFRAWSLGVPGLEFGFRGFGHIGVQFLGGGGRPQTPAN